MDADCSGVYLLLPMLCKNLYHYSEHFISPSPLQPSGSQTESRWFYVSWFCIPTGLKKNMHSFQVQTGTPERKQWYPLLPWKNRCFYFWRWKCNMILAGTKTKMLEEFILSHRTCGKRKQSTFWLNDSSSELRTERGWGNEKCLWPKALTGFTFHRWYLTC